jgi:hypothetical protein
MVFSKSNGHDQRRFALFLKQSAFAFCAQRFYAGFSGKLKTGPLRGSTQRIKTNG